MDSVPLVAITGQVATPMMGRDAFQETDVLGMVGPITKHSYLVERVEDIESTIHRAFEIARSGRPGPVLVDIPKDMQLKTADAQARPADRNVAPRGPDSSEIDHPAAL